MSVDRVRHLLDIIDLKKRDMAKYLKQVTELKREMILLLEKNDRYINNPATDIVLLQQNNIDIIDTNVQYKTAVEHLNKTQRTIHHLQNVISTIDIQYIITDIKINFV